MSLLAQTLCKVREDEEQVLLVAPYWPNRTWFPELMLLVTAPPWKIPLRRDLLSQRGGTLWRPHLVPSWDPPSVLSALRGAPFEPLQSVELKFLSLKTVLLAALATVKRVGDLQAFSVDDLCLEFVPGNSHVVLRPQPGYVPKVHTTPFRDQVVNLQALPLLCSVPSVPCASMWTARRASGPQTSSLSASEDSRREELSPNKDSPTG